MTQKDYTKTKLDFIKMLSNLIIGFAITLALYNMQNPRIDFITVIIFIILLFLIGVALLLSTEMKKLLNELKEQDPPLNIKLDISLNEGIFLKKEDAFKIILEKDEKGNIIIRRITESKDE